MDKLAAVAGLMLAATASYAIIAPQSEDRCYDDLRATLTLSESARDDLERAVGKASALQYDMRANEAKFKALTIKRNPDLNACDFKLDGTTLVRK